MTTMRRIFPAPLLSVALFALWLALAGSLAAGQVALALLVAVAAPLLSAPLRPLAVRVRKPLVLARLFVEVLGEALRSNLRVGRRIAAGRGREPRSAFVRISLDLRDANGLAVLAAITTVVPGTVWSELSVDGGELLLHVFDLDDEAAFIEHYKSRYERPVMEIFE